MLPLQRPRPVTKITAKSGDQSVGALTIPLDLHCLCAALSAIPIIAVSSFALTGDDAKARASGSDDYVTKPYSTVDLLRITALFSERRHSADVWIGARFRVEV